MLLWPMGFAQNVALANGFCSVPPGTPSPQAQLGTAQLGTAQLGTAQLGTAQLGTAQLARAWNSSLSLEQLTQFETTHSV